MGRVGTATCADEVQCCRVPGVGDNSGRTVVCAAARVAVDENRSEMACITLIVAGIIGLKLWAVQ
jgi:hypothetical protein